MEVKKKLEKARALLVLDQPFFGVLALRMKMVEEAAVPTMATNGELVLYNPDFVDKLSVTELKGVLAHEVMHAGLGHHWRIGDRDLMTWNKAADYAVNDIILNSGFELPEGHLYDACYHDIATEELYQKLFQENPPGGGSQEQGSGQGDGQDEQDGKGGGQNQQGQDKPSPSHQQPNSDPGGCGGIIPIKDKAQAKEQEQEWKSALVQAASVAKGKLPSQIKRMIDEIINPELPWTTLLRDFVEKTARNDYNWMRANKRHIVNGVWMPSLISEELPEIVIAIDTSGSINDEMLAKFAAEASGVLEAYRTTIHAIYCDAAVQGVDVFTNEDLPLKFNPKGGGGTDFRPVFDYVDKQGLTPACLVYFTDMYGTFPDLESPYPTMWVSTTKGEEAPWGQTVDFN